MAEEIIVTHGCTHLSGTVRVSGAKNSALKLIAAALLGQGKSVLYNVPNISDIDIMIEVLESLGASVERTGHTIAIDTANATGFETPYELVSKMRASISILGPLIGRFGKARVADARRLQDRCAQDRHASFRARSTGRKLRERSWLSLRIEP